MNGPSHLFSRISHWRRSVVPADLPPVPVHAGLLADVDDPIAKPQPAPEPEPKPTAPEPPADVLTVQRPLLPEPDTAGLSRLNSPRPRLVPGRYVVQYSRIGRYGSTRSGLPRPVPLTCTALDEADLAGQILHDCRHYLGHEGVQVVVDTTVLGGVIRLGDRPAGTFTFQRRGGSESR